MNLLRFHLCAVSLFLGLASSQLYAQISDWTTYVSGRQISCQISTPNWIWVGTSGGGLVRIDPVSGSSTIFDKNNSPLPDNFITAMAYAGGETFWIGTNRGLTYYDGTDWINRITANLQSGFIQCMAVDSQQHVWIGTYGAGVVEYDTSIVARYDTANSDLPGNYVFSIDISETGKICVKCDDQVFVPPSGGACFDGTQWIDLNLSEPICGPTLIDTADVLWTGAEGALWELSSPSPTLYTPQFPIQSTDWGSAMFEDANGKFWLGWGDPWLFGLPEQGKLTSFSQGQFSIIFDWPGDYITAISQDSQGDLWLGSSTNGVYRYDQQSFVNYSTNPSGLHDNRIRTIAVAPDGTAWAGMGSWPAIFGNVEEGVSFFDGQSWTELSVTNSDLPNNDVKDILIDTKNQTWIATDGGLVSIDDGIWTTLHTGNSGLASNLITSLHEAEDSMLWIGTDGSGIQQYDGNSWTTYSSTNSALPSDGILSVMTLDEEVWIGTKDSGLVRYDGMDWLHMHSGNSNLPANQVFDIAIDSSQYVWIATRNGLVWMIGSVLTIFTSDNSPLESNYISALEVDTDGVLWIATRFNGLASFDGSNWMLYHTANSGLPHNTIQDLDIDSQGNIWMATLGGIAVLHRDTIQTSLEDKYLSPPFSWKIYPNPASSPITIDLSLQQSQEVDIQLLHLNGQHTMTHSLGKIAAGLHQIPLQTMDLAAGMYLLRLRVGDWTEVKKIILE
ncbi:MAG: two-component regulator propeller domain-containing protein [Bacteroidota bacterium]